VLDFFFPINHYQNVIQKKFNSFLKIKINVHFWYIYIIMYVIESILKINFSFSHLDKY
jgi:hypothetical protein